MPVPSVFKSAPFLYGTTGTVGVAGVVATGGQFLGGGGSEYTTENTPFVGKFKSKPNADLGLNDKSINAQIDSSYGCFSNFFDGVTVSTSNSQDTLSSIDSFTQVNPTTVADQDKADPVGCMVMQLSYDLKEQQNPKGVFKGELTIKSGNIGWAIWLSGYGGKHEQSSTQYGQQMDYKLVFLEKDSSDSWEIKTGLGGTDGITSSDFSVRIADPTGKVGIDEKVSKGSTDDLFGSFKTEPKSQVLSYSGVWGANESGNEVFKDVNILENNEEYAKIFLGIEGGFGKDIEPDYIYIYDKGSWKRLTTSPPNREVSKEDLNKGYKPFKGKKGKGVDTDNYCTAYPNACTSQ